jgi:phenylpropionate dioxygenase-like ring-hydroxylating dioxygenase large terminal subunit
MARANGFDLNALIDGHRDGFSMEKPFYLDGDVFEADLEKIIVPAWHLIDHVSRIPNAGDYFLFELAGESIIVVRGKDHEIRAFYNVCRHRGSRICREDQGNVRMLRCPYHAWSYDLDGSLKAARLMEDDFDADDYGLHPCHIEVCEGLIFCCLAQGDAPDFDDQMKPLLPFLELHDLGNAKIAHRASYPTEANWKLVMENFYECYHCMPAHPEYCEVHPKDYVLALGGGEGSGPIESLEAYRPQMEAFGKLAESMGHVAGRSPEDGENCSYLRGASRTAIKEGYLSETKDGTPAGPLMGKFNDWDGGYTGVTLNPFFTMLATNDFATMFRFIPRDATYTDVELIWLVGPDAEAGENLDLEKMIWMWDVTTIADKTIIEDNHAGVMSRKYEPGPYSRHEAGTNAFIRWYLSSLAVEISDGL